MKIFLHFSLLLATATLLMGTSDAKDFEKAATEIEEIRSILKSMVHQIKEIVIADSAKLAKSGDTIADKILKDAKEAAKSGTLTQDKAKETLEKLRDGLNIIKDEVHKTVKLSKGAQDEIQETFKSKYASVEHDFKKLLTFLQ